jgi:UDPglucose 6-dehydrogenase
MKRSIACIGQGFVGGSLTTVLSERGILPYVYDKAGYVATGGLVAHDLYNKLNPEDQTLSFKDQFQSIKKMVELCEDPKHKGFTKIYFVCVPTPAKLLNDNTLGEADLSIVENVLQELSDIPGKRIAVIKSTVSPGSTEKWNKQFIKTGLRIVFCPEFLTEKNALEDMRNQDRIILGGPKKEVNQVRQIFKSAFPDIKIVNTSSTNAELTKYVVNNFLSLKVSYANELYQLCDKLGETGLDCDFSRVIECATLDTRIGNWGWQVPSYEIDEETGEPLAGFSLSCWPKDLHAMIAKAKELGIKPTILQAAWAKNLEVRPKIIEELKKTQAGRAIIKKNC